VEELLGRKIVEIRPLTLAELKGESWEGWPFKTVALVLDDGTLLYPSRDGEGNGPGQLFGKKADGTCFMVD